MITPQFQVTVVEETPLHGIYTIAPLPRGYGNTLGNSLRRIMLSSLEGAAVTNVRIKGVTHQFDTLKGVKEDIIELILRIKQIRFRSTTEDEQKFVIKKKGNAIITAGDIQDSSLCEVINKDLVLCELAEGGVLDMELTINRGVGYQEAEELEDKGFDVIRVDALYAPVRQVAVAVEQTRVSRLTNNDKLTLTIDTDGSITGREAFQKASDILLSFIKSLTTGGVKLEEQDSSSQELIDARRGTQDMMVDELDLPTRVINALVKNKIETVAQLKQLTDEDFSKIRGLGKKSIDELKEKLVQMNI